MDQDQEKREVLQQEQEPEKNYPGKFVVDILKICLDYKQFQYGTKKEMLR